jgi:hypothetical protein
VICLEVIDKVLVTGETGFFRSAVIASFTSGVIEGW